MSQDFPLIRYTGLSAYVEAYARGAYAFPILSLFGTKASVQAIGAALVGRNSEVKLVESGRVREVYLAAGEYRLFGKALPCGAHQLLVINTGAMLKHCAPPSFYLMCRNSEEQIQPRYFAFLDRLVPIPLLRNWENWLWERGIEKGEIETLEGYRLSAYECRVDPDLLKNYLSRAIRKKQLRLKELPASKNSSRQPLI
jgi:hypothetical protein